MIKIIKIAVFTILLTLSQQAPDFKCPNTAQENNCDSTKQYCNASNVCSNAGVFGSQCSEKSTTITDGIVCQDNYVCGLKKQCLQADGVTCQTFKSCSGYCDGRQCVPRVALGATCGQSDQCLSNKCDEVKNQCVAALKDQCKNNTECQTGAICSSNGTCLLETKQKCKNNNECVSNLCQSDKCVSQSSKNAGNTGKAGNTGISGNDGNAGNAGNAGNTGNTGISGNAGNAGKAQKTSPLTENFSSGEIRYLSLSAMLMAVATFFL